MIVGLIGQFSEGRLVANRNLTNEDSLWVTKELFSLEFSLALLGEL